ncbi:MAG: protein kinase [Polyangiales bacterium]
MGEDGKTVTGGWGAKDGERSESPEAASTSEVRASSSTQPAVHLDPAGSSSTAVSKPRAVGTVPSGRVRQGGRSQPSEPAPDGHAYLLRPGELLEGRYRIVRAAAHGGCGEVYEAEDREIPGRRLAIKIVLVHGGEEGRAGPMRELRMLASVRHPSVVNFHDFGWVGDKLMIVMPWLEGETLEDKRLDRLVARPIFEKLAAGVSAIHAVGLRHHDIKPANVFLAKVHGFDGTIPTLIDLGTAVAADEALLGFTPRYASPEVAKAALGDAIPVGPAADVYSLALSLREVLEPETFPRDDADPRAVLARRITERIPPFTASGLRYLDPHFARWLADDPDARPSADEFLGELAVLSEPEVRAAERRAKAKWYALGGVLALVAAVALGLFFRASKQAEQNREAAVAARREAETAAGAADAAWADAAEAKRRAAEAEQHQNESDEARQRADELRRIADEKTRQARSIEAAALVARHQAQEAESEERGLRQAAEARASQLQAERGTMLDLIANLRSQLVDATRDRDAARQSITRLEQARDIAVSEAQRLASERDSAATERDALAARVRDAEAARDAVDAARQAAEARVRELSAQLERLQAGAPPAP